MQFVQRRQGLSLYFLPQTRGVPQHIAMPCIVLISNYLCGKSFSCLCAQGCFFDLKHTPPSFRTSKLHLAKGALRHQPWVLSFALLLHSLHRFHNVAVAPDTSL